MHPWELQQASGKTRWYVRISKLQVNCKLPLGIHLAVWNYVKRERENHFQFHIYLMLCCSASSLSFTSISYRTHKIHASVRWKLQTKAHENHEIVYMIWIIKFTTKMNFDYANKKENTQISSAYTAQCMWIFFIKEGEKRWEF